MNNHAALPAHIKQLVDKKNYVIAIKTHAEERGISMDEAKNQIDAYEQSQLSKQNSRQHNGNTAPAGGFNNLTQGLDHRITQENIKMPLVPYWVKRVTVILLVIAIIGFMLYRLFR